MGKHMQGLVQIEHMIQFPSVMLFHGIRASRIHSAHGKAGDHEQLLLHDGSMGLVTILSKSIHPSLMGARHCLGTLESRAKRQESVLCKEARPEIIHPTPNELGLGNRPGHRA